MTSTQTTPRPDAQRALVDRVHRLLGQLSPGGAMQLLPGIIEDLEGALVCLQALQAKVAPLIDHDHADLVSGQRFIAERLWDVAQQLHELVLSASPAAGERRA